jgi:hypothetical protein
MATEITASWQNTRAMQPGDVLNITAPRNGMSLGQWQLANFGPGALWARWDGLADAAAGDEGSILLPANSGFFDISGRSLSVACTGDATRISFTSPGGPMPPPPVTGQTWSSGTWDSGGTWEP